MVWACLKNGWVSFGQKGFDGRSKWRAGTRETEVILDGWSEGGLGQQRNDCAWRLGVNARKIVKSGEPWCISNWMSFTRHFCLALCSFGPPSRALVVITWRGVGCRYMIRLGQTVKNAKLLNTTAQMSSIWDKRCMLTIVCVLSDLTWLYPSLVVGESHGILFKNLSNIVLNLR